MIAHELLTAPSSTQAGAKPERWMIFLHGILGTRGNWRSFARRWLAARPAWGAALVDLRKHGGSQAFDPPHTVALAARDLDALPVRADAILGHSFGGKVALQWVKDRGGDCDVAFVIDSTPGARPDLVGTDYGAYGIARMLARAPKRAKHRDDYLAFMLSEGVDRETAQWLAMNVRRAGDEFELGIDMRSIEALLDDYFSLDLWDVVLDPKGRAKMHFVIGTRGSVPEEDRARLRASSVALHALDAGHWVHVDAPDALLEIVVRET